MIEHCYKGNRTKGGRKFEDIEEGCECWSASREGTGSGNAGIEPIEDVRMREVVPEIPATKFKLTDDKQGQTIRKKKKSALGPDLLANFWWKN